MWQNYIFAVLIFVPATQALVSPDSKDYCLYHDSPPPRCEDYINHENGEPVFIPHVFNCSRFWVCRPDLTDCLIECPPDNIHGGSLFFDVSILYPYGPTCNWPEQIDCTMKNETCQCETWQTCVNHIDCIPDCKLDTHCNDEEYCDFPDGGTGVCINGCRNNADCNTCGSCVNHLCKEPDCCSDADCPNGPCINGSCGDCSADLDCAGCAKCDNNYCISLECCSDSECLDSEYCAVDNTCKTGCRVDSDCPLSCETCDNHVCSNPECCTDSECLDSQYCNTDLTCKDGCRVDSDCPLSCETCDNHVCSNPECCTDAECLNGEYCDSDLTCKPGCREDSECSPSCATCESHACTTPECCVDDDCAQPEPICGGDLTCEPGCRDDTWCPGFDAICNVLYSNCNYCNSTDNSVGQCNPGCHDDQNCIDDTVCNGFHNCITVGTEVLKKIILKTDKCNGCQGTPKEDGPIMYLVGGEGAGGRTTCTTNQLDHPTIVDYAAGSTAAFEEAVDKDALGSCNRVSLLREISEGTIQWTSGQGEWSLVGGRVDFEWSGSQFCTYSCCLSQTSLSPSKPTANLIKCENNCNGSKVC